jgi:hypothetical protein
LQDSSAADHHEAHCHPQDFDECLKLIEQVLQETDGLCEFALYVKALIKRQRGEQLAIPRNQLLSRACSFCEFSLPSLMMLSNLGRRADSGLPAVVSASHSHQPTQRRKPQAGLASWLMLSWRAGTLLCELVCRACCSSSG